MGLKISRVKSAQIRGRRCIWLLGFFLVANIYLIPWLTQSPRATDLIGVILGLVLFVRLAIRGLRPIPLITLLLLVTAPIAWTIYALDVRDWATISRSIRWFVALPWAYMLFVMSREPESRCALVWGMWWGVIVNLGVVIMQFLGQDRLMQAVGLAARDEQLTTVYGLLRYPGMHGCVNASAAVISLAVPLSLTLFYESSKSIGVVIIGLTVLAVSTGITLSRSPALVAATTLTIVLLFSLRFRRSVKLFVLLVAACVVAITVLGPPGGWQRWTDIQNYQMNLSGRVYTNITSLKLLAQHPLGIGVSSRGELVGATHNAFLQASLEYGLLFGIFIFCLMLTMASRVLWGLRGLFGVEGVLALHMTGLFFFEEHLNNPTFIILCTWVSISAVEWISLVLKRSKHYNTKGLSHVQ